MCLRVDASGYIDQKDTFISVYLYMKDLHDIAIEHYSHCKWPLSGEFSVEILNHYTDSIHQHQNMLLVSNPEISEFEFFNNTNLIFSGLGCYNFISHKILSGSKHIYSGNDTLYFRILYDDKTKNVVHQHHSVDQFKICLFKMFTEYIFFPFLTLCISDIIFDGTQIWATNDAMAVILFLLPSIVIGVFAMGNLLGGILWLMAFILASQFRIEIFPDQERIADVCMVLTLVAVKVLLVNVLQLQRNNILSDVYDYLHIIK